MFPASNINFIHATEQINRDVWFIWVGDVKKGIMFYCQYQEAPKKWETENSVDET